MCFLLFRIFQQLALALKNRGCPEFTILNVFFIIQDFWATCAYPENFRSIEYIFYYSGVLSNLRLPWRQSCPGIFHCIEYTFYIQNFWVTWACPEKQRVPWIYCIECIFFIIQDIWATCACPEKQSCSGIFHCTEIYFIIQDFWRTCGCHENRVCPESFQARGGGRPPPALYAYDTDVITSCNCTDDGSRSNRNICKISFTSSTLGVIFIITASSFSKLFVTKKLLLSMNHFTSSNWYRHFDITSLVMQQRALFVFSY